MLLEVKMLVIPGERLSDGEGYEGGDVLVLDLGVGSGEDV